VLDLFLPQACATPPQLQALLPALAEVIGTTLEASRAAQENLRTSLIQERRLIAGEVHDSLAQNLTSARMRSSLLRDAIGSGDQPRAFEYLREIDDSLAHAHARVRELITHFRTQMDPSGLVPALRRTIEELNHVGSIHIDFGCRVGELALSAEQELQVYYIVREALANALKHSGGRNVRLLFERRRGGYEIVVEDDGLGLRATQDGSAGHFGLKIMRERAGRLGGALAVSSPAGGGTRVRLRFPAVGGGAAKRERGKRTGRHDDAATPPQRAAARRDRDAPPAGKA
jgi:two-component system nitrate/nitrite sensor histidine kinase NarX